VNGRVRIKFRINNLCSFPKTCCMFTKTDIERYFLAEKQESVLFLIAGIVAIILALVFFLALRSPFYKGAALLLLMVGFLQLLAGGIGYKSCDEDRVRNVYAYDMNPGKLQQEELPRMKDMHRHFVVYRWTAIAFLLAALGIIVFCRTHPSQQFWYGLGLSLAIEAAVMLGGNVQAERRAYTYIKGLESFLQKRH